MDSLPDERSKRFVAILNKKIEVGKLKVDNSNQIRTVRNEAKARGIAFADFTSTMTVGTSIEQVNRTADTPEVELDYWGICLFGDTNTLREFTGKFSLFN